MRRDKTVSQILLVLSVVHVVLAGPEVARQRHPDVTEGAAAVSKERRGNDEEPDLNPLAPAPSSPGQPLHPTNSGSTPELVSESEKPGSSPAQESDLGKSVPAQVSDSKELGGSQGSASSSSRYSMEPTDFGSDRYYLAPEELDDESYHYTPPYSPSGSSGSTSSHDDSAPKVDAPSTHHDPSPLSTAPSVHDNSAPVATVPSTHEIVPVSETPSTHEIDPLSEPPSTHGIVPVPEAPSTHEIVPVSEAPSTHENVPVPETPSAHKIDPVSEPPSTHEMVPVPEAPLTHGIVPVSKAPSTHEIIPVSETSSTHEIVPVSGPPKDIDYGEWYRQQTSPSRHSLSSIPDSEDGKFLSNELTRKLGVISRVGAVFVASAGIVYGVNKVTEKLSSKAYVSPLFPLLATYNRVTSILTYDLPQ